MQTTKITTLKEAAEHAEGYASARREIEGERLTQWAARRYLDMVPPREGDAFDAGFTRAMREHAERSG